MCEAGKIWSILHTAIIEYKEKSDKTLSLVGTEHMDDEMCQSHPYMIYQPVVSDNIDRLPSIVYDKGQVETNETQ
ncbi:hypothetical protein TorRG33x02_332370, partial [Trema orientale]